MKVKNAKKKKQIKKGPKEGAIQKPSKKAQWKKVKLNGNLLSDDGGLGLEGLIGLEILEDVKGVVSITKDKPVRVKREKKLPQKEADSDDSDSERKKPSKNERKKKKKELKKSKDKKMAKQNNAGDDEPGKFVRPLRTDNNVKKSKEKKGKKSKQTKQDDSSIEPSGVTMDDLIVSYLIYSIGI